MAEARRLAIIYWIFPRRIPRNIKTRHKITVTPALNINIRRARVCMCVCKNARAVSQANARWGTMCTCRFMTHGDKSRPIPPERRGITNLRSLGTISLILTHNLIPWVHYLTLITLVFFLFFFLFFFWINLANVQYNSTKHRILFN